ncbi:hypothetical protein FRC11_010040, partial [Ceratobasidium sp. 423]
VRRFSKSPCSPLCPPPCKPALRDLAIWRRRQLRRFPALRILRLLTRAASLSPCNRIAPILEPLGSTTGVISMRMAGLNCMTRQKTKLTSLERTHTVISNLLLCQMRRWSGTKTI